jgi:kynurenine formamidase
LLDLLGRGLRVFDLGRPMFVGMPQSPNHPVYWHTLQRRHGDVVRRGGGSASNDLLITGAHVGTHIDALAHVSQDGKLYGGVDAAEAQVGGRFMQLGIHALEPIVCRGVLLDIPAVIGAEVCAADYEVTPDDLDAAVKRQGTAPGPGDVVLIRTGWGTRFDEGESFIGGETGTPGVGEAGAKWIAATGVRCAGAETIAFERIAPGEGHSVLPAHRVLLVEHGIHILETMALEELARERVHEFLFVLTPLNLVGATGSPVRPLALVTDG